MQLITQLLLLIQLLICSPLVNANDDLQKESFNFNIPQQQADYALPLFAGQADLTLILPLKVIEGISTNRLVGRYSVSEAIDILLEGTVLKPAYNEQGQLINITNILLPEENKMRQKKKGILTAVAAFFIGSGVSTAQDNISSGAAIEEMIVTAQKREESLQDIPIAVTAFDGATLNEDGVASLHDLGNRTPGLVFSTFGPGQPEIAIRGIGTKEDGAAASDSTVVSIDDVYVAARTAQVFDIFDLERVEVLRGPQGTLYGKNSIGGSINFITTKPTEETKIRFQQSVGNYGRFDTGALFSGALSDTAFGKISISRREHDGYLRNLFVGERQGESNTLAIRSQLRWVPSENVEWLFTASFADDEFGQTNREPLGSTGPLHDCGCASDPIAVNEVLGGADDGHTTLAETEGFTDRDVTGFNAKLNWDRDNYTLTSITAYRESDFNWLEDAEGLPPAPFVDLTSPSAGAGLTAPASVGFTFDVNDAAVEDTEQITQEIRLSGESDRGLTWVAGVFYSKEDIERTERFSFTTLGGSGPFSGLSDAAANQKNDSTSWAAYGQATYPINDRINLTGGIRYSYEEKNLTVSNELFSGLPLLLRPFDEATASDDWQNVSGRLALDYSLNDDVLLYASVATGFKSGGFTGAATSLERATTPFDEEKAVNYETGIKGLWLDHRLQTNVSAFFTDYTDLQVTRFFQPLGGTFGQFITENAGEADIKGFELEFVALLTDHIEVGGSYAYLDAEFTEFSGTPDVSGGGDFSGNILRQAPENSVNLYLKYGIQLSGGSNISAKLNYRYQDELFFDPNNNPITIAPSYDLWDARLAWESSDLKWGIAAWIKNINDEDYVQHTFSQRGSRISFAQFGDPRTYGLTLTYNYGG